jgi:hypothetical protein
MQQTESTLYIKQNSDKIIVCFGGLAGILAKIPVFEFRNFLNKTIPNYSSLYLIDIKQCWYHKGLKGRTRNIPSTIRYLRNIIRRYSEVTFIGVSMGGYAAILFGSLLNIKNVISFIPQTIINRSHAKTVNNKYFNLKKFINTTTNYQIYGNLNCPAESNHSIHHCNNINIYDNVTLIARDHLCLKQMRGSGELENIIKSIVN